MIPDDATPGLHFAGDGAIAFEKPFRGIHDVPSADSTQAVILRKMFRNAQAPVRMRRSIVVGDHHDVACHRIEAGIESLHLTTLHNSSHTEKRFLTPAGKYSLRFLIGRAGHYYHLIGDALLTFQRFKASLKIHR